MKTLVLILCLALKTAVGISQSLPECEKAVSITAEAISRGSSDKMQNLLAEGFSISGQEGAIAQTVLKQLIGQLNDSVVFYKQLSQNQTARGLELIYTFSYEKLGERETNFLFNSANKIVEFKPFDMQVKTMNEQDIVFQKPEAQVIEIPIKRARNLILVDVILNGKPKTFLLDSGSPITILNTRYLPSAGDETRSMSSSRGVNSSITGMDIQRVEKLNFAGIELINSDVITLDISHLEEDLGAEIHGLIGYDFLKDYDVMFDYKSEKVTLFQPEYNSMQNEASINRIPFELVGHIPVIKGKVGDQTMRFGIDCGAENSLFSIDHYAGMKRSLKNVKKATLKGADKTETEVIECRVKNTMIGHISFKDTKAMFSDISHLNEGYNLGIDGLIGYDVLSARRCMISYARQELIIF